MNRLADCRLYGILDLGYVPREKLVSVAAQMVAGGVDILQLRAKRYAAAEASRFAAQVLAVTREAGVPLIINDFLEVAAEIGAQGVHTGQDDPPPTMERWTAGPGLLVGRSTHSLAQAIAAAEDTETDYLGFGPLFATPTKPDYRPIGLEEIRAVHERVAKPIFCIGGIKLENLAEVIQAGARRVVIVSGILQAADIAEYCREAKALLPRGSEL